jgi:hypothetical protein
MAKAKPVKKKRSIKGGKVDTTSRERGEGGMGVPARKSPCPRPPSLSAEVPNPQLARVS